MFRRSSNQSGRGSSNVMQPQQQRMVMTHDGSHWVQQQPVYMQVGGAYAPHVVSHQVMLTETSNSNNHKMQQQDYQQQQQPQHGAARTAYMGHDGMLYYYQAPVQPQPQPQPQERVAVQPQQQQQQALPAAASPAEVAARQQRSAAALGFDRFVDKVKRAFTVDLPGAKPTAPVQQAAPQVVTQPQQQQPQQSQPSQPQHKQQPQHPQTQPQHYHHHQQGQQQQQQQQQQLQAHAGVPSQQQQQQHQHQLQAHARVPSQQQQQQQVIPAHHQYAHAAATPQEPAVIHRGATATLPAAATVGASHHHHQTERGQPQHQQQHQQQPQWQRDQTAAFEVELQQLYQRHQQQQQQLFAYQQQQLQMQPSPWAQYELQVQFQDQQQRLAYSQQQEQQELLQRQQVQRYYAAVAAGTAAGGVGITSSTTQHYHIETVRGADGVYRQVYVPDAPLAAPLSPSRPMLEAAKAPATPAPAPTAASASAAVTQPVVPAASAPVIPAPSVVSATTAPAAAASSPAPVAITRPGSPALPPAQPLQNAAPHAPVRAPVQVFGAPLIRRGASLDDCSRQLPSPRAQLNVDESDLPQVLADPLDDSFTTVSPLSSAVSPVVLPRSTRAPLRAPSLPARPIYHRDDAPNGDAWFGTPTKARLPAPDASTPAEPQVLAASGASSSAAAPPAGVQEEVIVAAPVAAPVGHAHYETELGIDGSPSASPRGTRQALEAISREVQLHRELLQTEGSLRVGPRDDDSTPRSVDDLTANGKVVYEASMRLLFALDSLDGLSAASRIKRKTLVNAVMSLQDDILHP